MFADLLILELTIEKCLLRTSKCSLKSVFCLLKTSTYLLKTLKCSLKSIMCLLNTSTCSLKSVMCLLNTSTCSQKTYMCFLKSVWRLLKTSKYFLLNQRTFNLTPWSAPALLLFWFNLYFDPLLCIFSGRRIAINRNISRLHLCCICIIVGGD